MAAPDTPLNGDALLAAVTDAMVALHERYYHRAPGTAKTQMMGGDLLACVLGGVYTDVEKTLIELAARHDRHKTTAAPSRTRCSTGSSPPSSACPAAASLRVHLQPPRSGPRASESRSAV